MPSPLLNLAAESGYAEVVKVLLDDAHVPVDSLGEFGTSPLFDACYFDNRRELFVKLQVQGIILLVVVVCAMPMLNTDVSIRTLSPFFPGPVRINLGATSKWACVGGPGSPRVSQRGSRGAAGAWRQGRLRGSGRVHSTLRRRLSGCGAPLSLRAGNRRPPPTSPRLAAPSWVAVRGCSDPHRLNTQPRLGFQSPALFLAALPPPRPCCRPVLRAVTKTDPCESPPRPCAPSVAAPPAGGRRAAGLTGRLRARCGA